MVESKGMTSLLLCSKVSTVTTSPQFGVAVIDIFTEDEFQSIQVTDLYILR